MRAKTIARILMEGTEVPAVLTKDQVGVRLGRILRILRMERNKPVAPFVIGSEELKAITTIVTVRKFRQNRQTALVRRWGNELSKILPG